MSNNHITLIGRVGQHPKSIGFKDSDNKVVKFSVGVKEYSSKTEEDITMWFDVDAWNGLGERVLQTITKGREVMIHGRLVLSTYKKEVNGMVIDWPKAHVKLSSFHLCGKKPESGEETKTEETKTEETKTEEAPPQTPKKKKLAVV